MAGEPVGYDGAFVGPLAEAAGEFSGGTGSGGVAAAGGGDQWIVRLTEAATRLAGAVRETERLLDAPGSTSKSSVGWDCRGRSWSARRSARAGRRPIGVQSPHGALRAGSHGLAQAMPNDPDFPSLTGLHNVGQFGATPDADIDAPEAWDMNTGSTNVVVGVIDSGIDVTHPDLYLNIWLNQGEIPADAEVAADRHGRRRPDHVLRPERSGQRAPWCQT